MQIKELREKIATIDGEKVIFLKVTIKDEDGNEVKMDLTLDDLTTEYGIIYLSPGKIINVDETNEEPGPKMTLEKIKSLAQKEMENCDHESEEYKALFEIYEFIDDMEQEKKMEKLYLSDFSLDELMDLEALFRARAKDWNRENSLELLEMAEKVLAEIIERAKN